MSGLLDRWKMFSFEDLNPRLLGAVSVALMGAMVGLTAFVALSGILDDRVDVTADFQDVSGLRTGSTVRVAGIEVGKVTRIAPNFDRGIVTVTFEIDSDVELAHDTRALLASETLFGGQQIRLEFPTGVEPGVTGAQVGHIDLERTRRAVDVVQAIDAAAQNVEGVDTDLLENVSIVLAELAEANRGQLDGLFEGIQQASSALGAREEQLEHLLNNAQQVSATLTDRTPQILQLLEGAANLMDELSQREDDIRGLLGDGTSALVDLSAFVRDHRAHIEGIVGDLGDVVASVQGDLDNLDRSLAYIGPAFGALPRTRGDGDWADFLLTGFGDPRGQE